MTAGTGFDPDQSLLAAIQPAAPPTISQTAEAATIRNCRRRDWRRAARILATRSRAGTGSAAFDANWSRNVSRCVPQADTRDAISAFTFR